MNKQIFCGRKKGVTIKGKFYPRANVSDIIADDLNRKNNKMETRNRRRNN